MIFYVKEDLKLITSFMRKSEHASDDKKMRKYSSFSQIECILFLSYLLSPAETYYWSTKIKIACLVWVIKKIYHIMKSVKRTIILSDHASTVDIATQISLNITLTVKLNLQLIYALKYLQRFNLNIQHILSKKNMMSDALSHLDLKIHNKSNESHLELNALYVYFFTSVRIDEKFKAKII